MKRTIIFRADGGSSIGMGHFTRTLALAEMLNEHFHCIFATRQPTEYQIAEIEKICHGRINLPEDDSHFDRFLEHLAGNEIVVLDNYYFTTDYQKSIKAKGCKLVCIDDLNDKDFYADVIINHSIGVSREEYNALPNTFFALGLGYALLRPAFLTINERQRKIEKIETLFVCFGGADPNNLTKKTLEIVLKHSRFKRIIAVIGDGNKHFELLKTSVAKNPRLEIYKSIDDKKMAKLMTESDLAIIPSSGTLIEAIYIGLPVISGYYVSNQKKASKKFFEAGLIIFCGDLLVNYKIKLDQILTSLSLAELNKILLNQKEISNSNHRRFIRIFKRLN